MAVRGGGFGCLAAADLGIDTSLQSEVSPVKAMEYLAFGLPVVAFDLLETRRTMPSCGASSVEPDVDGSRPSWPGSVKPGRISRWRRLVRWRAGD